MRVSLQIALNTFREIVHEPVCLLITWFALVLIALLPTFALFVFREQEKMVVDGGLATVLFFGLALAVLSAANAVTREIERGTAIAVLAKPVTRFSFILGKVFGIMAVLSLFWILGFMASLMSVRAAVDQFRYDQAAIWMSFGCIAGGALVGGVRNYVSRGSFTMNALISTLVLYPVAMLVLSLLGGEPEAGVSYSWEMVPAFILLLYALWILGGLATALSTRLSLLANLNICGAVFLVGLMSDFLLGRYIDTSIWARIGYAVIPNWQLLWMADALAAGKSIPLAYIGWGALYTLALLIFFIGLALILFQNREVGAHNVR